MNTKVLSLDDWMKRLPYSNEKQYYTEVKPIFYRDGIYLYGDCCWFEVDGIALAYSPEDFQFKLDCLNAVQYSMTEHTYNALQIANKEGFLSSYWQNMLWKRDFSWRLHRDMGLLKMQTCKRIEKYKQIKGLHS